MKDWTFNDVAKKMAEFWDKLEEKKCYKRGPVGKDKLPQELHTAGVYVFYERDKAMYVGRSDDLLKRIRTHGNPGSGKSKAAFASNIAKAKIMQTYKDTSPCPNKSDKQWRKSLDWELGKPESKFLVSFGTEFKKAKKEVLNMSFKVVEIEDSIDQAIFEIYASMKLKTPYNNFDNH